MKKHICFMLALIFCLNTIVFNVAASSAYPSKFSFDFSELSSLGMWSTNDAENENSEVKIQSDAAMLVCDTTLAKASADSFLASPYMTASDGSKILLSFDFEINLGAGTNLTQYLYFTYGDYQIDDSSAREALLRLRNGEIRVGDTDHEFDNLYGQKHNIMLEIDTVTGALNMYFDKNTDKYSGTADFSGADLSKIRFVYRNYYSNKQTFAQLAVYNFCASSSHTPLITSSIANGAEFIDVSSLDSLTVDFGTFLKETPDITLSVAEPDSDEFEDTGVSFVLNGFIAKAKLSSSLEPLKKYKITVPDITGYYDDVAYGKSFIFTTAPAGYSAPTVSLISPSDGTMVFEGEAISLLADAQSSYADISYVSFYANDKFIASDSSLPYSYIYTPDTPGNYEIKTIACDTVGGNSLADTALITVSAIEMPGVSISGITNGAVYSPDSAFDITLNVTKGSFDIAYTELYLDSELVGRKSDAPYTFVLDDCALGEYALRAVCYDAGGNKSEENLTFRISDVYTAPLTTLPTYWYNGGNNKIANVSQVEMKLSEKEGKLQNSNLYYAIKEPSNGIITITGVLKYSSTDIESNFSVGTLKTVELSGGKIKIGNETVSNVSYAANKPYSYSFEFDRAAKKIKFTLTDDETGENIVDSSASVSYSATPEFIRFFFSNAPSLDAIINVSDIKMYVAADYPYITDITADDGVSQPQSGAYCVICKLDGVVEGVTTANITVQNDIGTVALSSAELIDSSTIKIGFVNPLDSATTYKINFDENLVLLGKSPSGRIISGEFTTTPGAFDVIDGSFSLYGGISFTANLGNTGTAKNVTVIMVVYEDGVIKELTAQTASVPNGGGDVSTPKLSLPVNNPTAEAFVIDSWSSQLPVSSKLFKYKP